MAHDARAIANRFLDIAKDNGEPVTPMKLIKLVYIAHGWQLGITGQPLFEDTVEAWQYGPVVPSVYHAFKKFGNKQITSKATELDIEDWCEIEIREDMASSEEDLLQRIWDVYGKFNGIQLSNMTHKSGTPWDQVWNEQGGCECESTPIPGHLIKRYYKNLAEEHGSSSTN